MNALPFSELLEASSQGFGTETHNEALPFLPEALAGFLAEPPAFSERFGALEVHPTFLCGSAQPVISHLPLATNSLQDSG